MQNNAIVSPNVHLPFLQQLRQGVETIEKQLKLLKELSDSDFASVSSQQTVDDINYGKRIELEVRSTYVEATQLHNSIIQNPFDLNLVENEINALQGTLRNIEETSGIKDFGYKSFETYDFSTSSATKSRNEPDSTQESTSTVKFRLPEKVEPKEETTKLFPNAMIKKQEEQIETNRNEKIVRLNAAGRTPQPYDFGLTRRQTFLPQAFKNHRTYMDTPKSPIFDSSATSRFNIVTSSVLDVQKFQQSNGQIETPPNMSINSNADSFVTVEFTPGMTTKCKKEPKRFKNVDFGVLQSKENERKITPEQPFIGLTDEKTEKLMKTIEKKIKDKSDTPSPPTTTFNDNWLHKFKPRLN